ncbi:MAG: hypothetical protein M3Z08_09795 [Chloroflexota bacterium]|nr:hypothetical protein [Chloroflexota bacterium]
MTTIWDQGLKRLFEESPQDFVSWVLPGTTYLSFVSTEFQSKLHGQRYADIMCHCLFADQPVILHLEFQSAGDKKMARRLLEYNINAEDKYGCPVISCAFIFGPPCSGN